MNAIELFHQDGKSANVHYCEKCRIIKQTKEEAEQCCQPKLCACGAEVQQYHTLCRSCEDKVRDERERERFEKAEKVTEWDGPVYADNIGYNEGYFATLEDLEDWLASEEEEDGSQPNRPEYVWTCHTHRIVSLDYDNIVENATQESYDDWDPDSLTGEKELKSALEAFNEANKDQTYWTPNMKLALIMPARSKEADLT